MLSRDSEDEMWSRFVFELAIWPQEVTLARWTQPSGPLCLWQCFCWWSKYGRNFCNFTFSPQKLQHLLLRNGLVATWNRNKDKWKSSHIMGNVCTSQSYFLQDILQLFLGLRQVIFPQMHIVTSAGLSQHSWGIGSLILKTKLFNFFSEISRFFSLNLPLLLCWRSVVYWWAW